ncbi:hypothetical protein SBV1_370100 [Verrucomicrobia bacterium]|nr:hypothetical protein SBV1_370100 [Verrucomicrobiota bacterium]
MSEVTFVGPPSLKLRRAPSFALRYAAGGGWPPSQATMAFGEGVAGAAFQREFELLRKLQRFEGRIELDLPRNIFRGVRAFPGVVIEKPLPEVSAVAAIELRGIGRTLEDVSVEHRVAWIWMACHP